MTITRFLTEKIRDPRIAGAPTGSLPQTETKILSSSTNQWNDTYKTKYHTTVGGTITVSLTYLNVTYNDFIRGTESTKTKTASNLTVIINYDGNRTFNFECNYTGSGTVSETVTITYTPITANFIETMYMESDNQSESSNPNIYIHGILLDTNAVNTTNINDGAVTNAKIVDSTITNAKLVNKTITNAKLADKTVTTAKIADKAATTAKIGDAAVTNIKIADSAVTSAKIDYTIVNIETPTGATQRVKFTLN